MVSKSTMASKMKNANDKYADYGNKLLRSARQPGKSTMRMMQFLNWLSYSDRPAEFKPLEFKMESMKL